MVGACGITDSWGWNIRDWNCAAWTAKVPLTMKFRVSLSGSSSNAGLADKHVLVYTRNGKGYVHDNIQPSVDAIKKMGAENGFAVDVTDDPLFFAASTLKQYKAVVFANTNNECLEVRSCISKRRHRDDDS